MVSRTLLIAVVPLCMLQFGCSNAEKELELLKAQLAQQLQQKN